MERRVSPFSIVLQLQILNTMRSSRIVTHTNAPNFKQTNAYISDKDHDSKTHICFQF
jgi:hypothetical protein